MADKAYRNGVYISKSSRAGKSMSKMTASQRKKAGYKTYTKSTSAKATKAKANKVVARTKATVKKARKVGGVGRASNKALKKTATRNTARRRK